MKSKIKSWLKRYLVAEIFAIFGALIGGISINIISRNAIFTAFGATWGENIGYYGIILFNDLKKHRSKFTHIVLLKTLRNLILEFGPAEYLDSFVVRPFTMYFFPGILNNLTLGLIVGKLSADIIFYIPTIVSYELRKKILPE